jgi:HEPN domain-containing protein
MLKAHLCEVTQAISKRTHDLIFLVKAGKLEDIPSSHLDFIGKINNASILTRYPDDLQIAVKEYPKEVAVKYLKQTQDVLEWLKKHPHLQI